jgi:hypothetical protein
VRESGGGRVRLDVDVVAALFGLPGEELKFLDGGGVAGVTGKVVTGEDGLKREEGLALREEREEGRENARLRVQDPG